MKIILAANTSWFLYNFRLSLAHYLQSQGFEVVLLSPPDQYAEALQSSGLRWVPWRLGRKSTAAWSEGYAISQTLQVYRREKPDLVHHFTIKPVLYGTLAARLARTPAVVNSITGRGYVFLGSSAKTRLIRSFARGMYQQAYRHPNVATIFENGADRDFFLQQGLVPDRRAHLIESVGVDAQHFQPFPEPAAQIPLVVLPARLLWDKGVGALVEAARLLKNHTPIRFALVGTPDAGNPSAIPEERLQAWVREGAVEWWGWIDDMRDVYEQCHIVTLPSLAEGVPKTLLEAAACGRPIVATDVPGCREVVLHGVNGLLVPPNDPQALAEAIGRLAGDPEQRIRMGSAGRQLVLDKFTDHQVNAQTLNVYRQVLDGRDGINLRGVKAW